MDFKTREIRLIRPPSLPVLLLLSFALLRLAFVINTERFPYIDDLAGDSRPYRERASEISSGALVGDEVYFDAPLYPYFLAITGGRIGGSDLAPKIVQALLDTLSAWLIFRITLSFFGGGPALLALVLYGLYGFALFYCGILLKPVLAIFLALLAVSFLVGRRWFLAGLTLGFGVLVRGNFLFLFPLFLFHAFRKHGPEARRLGPMLLVAGGLALPVLSVTVRNGVVGNDFVLLTYHAGPTFYHGNNPASKGTYSPILPGRQNPAYEKRDAVRIAEERSGRPLKPSEISRFWFGEGFRYIAENPARFIRLTGRRAFLFWNGREIPDTFDFYIYRRLFPLLNIALVPFGVLAPLALLGWFFPTPLRGDARLLPWAVLSIFLSLVFLFIFGRYRLPAVPFLVPTAARFLYHAGKCLVRPGRIRAALPPLGLAAIAIVIANSWSPPKERITGLYNLGIRMEQLGRLAEAEALYREAVEESPRFAAGWNNLGGILLRGGAPEMAEQAFRSAVSVEPGHYLANRNLARIFRDRGDYGEAMDRLEQSAATERSADVLVEMAVIAELAGDRERALRDYSEALERDGDCGEAAINLGRLLYHDGETARAEGVLGRANRLLPSEPMAAIYLALARIDLGDLPGAEKAIGRWFGEGDDPLRPKADSRLLLLKARIHAARGDRAAAGAALVDARHLGLPTGPILELLTGGENLPDWGLRN